MLEQLFNVGVSSFFLVLGISMLVKPEWWYQRNLKDLKFQARLFSKIPLLGWTGKKSLLDVERNKFFYIIFWRLSGVVFIIIGLPILNNSLQVFL